MENEATMKRLVFEMTGDQGHLTPIILYRQTRGCFAPGYSSAISSIDQALCTDGRSCRCTVNSSGCNRKTGEPGIRIYSNADYPSPSLIAVDNIMITDRRVHRNVFINVILAFAGIVITLAAGFVVSDPIKLFLVGVGGAILGAAMTGYLLLIKSLDLTELVFEAMTSHQRATNADEERLTSLFRKKYYHYHATVVSGSRCWILSIFDFGQEFVPGGLRCKTSFVASDRRPMDYVIHGLILGRSLVLSDNIDIGPRCTHVEIFPFFGESYAAIAHGFLFHENWDAQPQVSPSLLAQQPVEGITGPGQVDEKNGKKLDERWARSVIAGNPLNLNPQIYNVTSLIRQPTPPLQ
jgi:hypothetical protein